MYYKNDSILCNVNREKLWSPAGPTRSYNKQVFSKSQKKRRRERETRTNPAVTFYYRPNVLQKTRENTPLLDDKRTKPLAKN